MLAQLSKIRLDKKQVFRVRDLTLRRDAISLSLNRGTIMFTEPVHGRVTGAVYVGSGEVVAIPPDKVERSSIYQFAGAPILNESFSAGFLRFTDDTFEDVVRLVADHAVEEVTSEDLEPFESWDRILAEQSSVFNFRILTDLLGRRDQPLFFAELKGDRLGWFDVVFDQRLVEEVVVLQSVERSGRPFTDLWASFNRRSEARDAEAHAHESKALIDILAYEIDATVRSDMTLETTVIMEARALQSGDRVLALDLSRFMKVTEVTGPAGTAASFYQTDRPESVARSGSNILLVVLAEPLQAGATYRLQFKMAGEVIEPRGRGIFFVGERGLWYPNLGHQDRARFRMRFRSPKAYSLVATGRKVSESDSGDFRLSEWESAGEYPVAGFNLGDFSILTNDEAPPVHVSVNNDVETIYKEIAARRALQRESAMRAAASLPRRGAATPEIGPVAPDYSAFSTRSLADNVLVEIRDTLKFFEGNFGPYPYPQLTVSQFPVNYSQGWPSLLYVSTLSFFTRDQRSKLGLTSESDFLYTELVRAHEVAHQWFGNKMGWRGYRDQWISEGFANYAGAMYLEHKYQDPNRVRAVLDRARDILLSDASAGGTVDATGPLLLGARLTNSRSPDGYMDTLYNKATWVIHMLRSMMRQEGAEPDRAFLRMTRDFVDNFEGKLASTWDFQRIVEKHMPRAMDLTSDGRLDWFFDQWVRGTGIPQLEASLAANPSRGAFEVSGRIARTGVGDDFIIPVPLYVESGGKREFLGRVIVNDAEVPFRFSTTRKPERILVDPDSTVLARIKVN